MNGQSWKSMFVGMACAVAVLAHSESAHAAGLLVSKSPQGGVLKIEEQSVRTTINNGIAVTEVTQVFRNTEKRNVEALYTFPVPQGASVANFSMWINGKEMVGEVLKKERAREIYESYKQVNRDPGLLEQVNFKTFEMTIFPIGPEAQQKVRLVYYQELNFDHDAASYIYPLATVTKPGLDSRTTGKFSFQLDVQSEVPIVKMNSPSHGDDIAWAPHSDRYWQGSLETKAGDLNRDIVIHLQHSRPRTGIDVIASRPAGEDGYLALSLTAGEELGKSEFGADYVFILDISGSMAEDGKLTLSRKSIQRMLGNLGPKDRYEVMTFNIRPTPLFKELRPAEAEQHELAEKFLRNQKASGGTVLAPAFNLAYRYGKADRTLNVILLSDGMTEPGERAELLKLIQDRPSYARVFCVGVGNEVNRPLLAQLAEESGGLAAFLSQTDDFERFAEAMQRKLLRPAGRNVKLRFEGGEVYDIEPAVLPSLYHGSPIRVYARYKKAGSIKVHLQAEVQGSPLEQSFEVKLPNESQDNPEIQRVWAFHRIEQLLREADKRGNRASVIDDVVRLGERYSIVTEYTSFLVLENDQEYQRWKIERRNLQRLSQERKAQEVVDRGLEKMRAEALAKLQPNQPVPDASPVAQNDSRPSSPPQFVSVPAPGSSNSGGGGRGGGAFEPLGALLLLGFGGVVVRRRRR